MQLFATHCCGMQEISSLSASRTPEEAMMAFCINTGIAGGKARYGSYTEGRCLYTHYVFTAAVYDKECSSFKQAEAYDPGRFNENGVERNYGAEFAAFIEREKLGVVATSGAEFNLYVHPDHKVQVWVWTPNETAVRAWYNNNKDLADYFKERANLQTYENAVAAAKKEYNEAIERANKQAEKVAKAHEKVRPTPVVVEAPVPTLTLIPEIPKKIVRKKAA